MRQLAIDIETFSSVDIKKSGLYKYVGSPDFDILIIAYKLDDEGTDWVRGEDVAKDSEFIEALQDPAVLKTAYNAQFERVCLSKYFGIHLSPEGWECTMIKAAMLGLPFGLDLVAKILRLPMQKLTEGKQLIKYFSMPCKPTKVNGMRTRNQPADAPEKWQAFIDYCLNDVEVEQAIRNKLSFYQFPEAEAAHYQLDQLINDTGVLLDPVLINNAILLSNSHTERLTAEAMQLTFLDNPNSAAQLKKWLSDATGEAVEKLRKEDVTRLLGENANNEQVSRLLMIRREMAKTSIKKYISMVACACSDSRARGLLQFYGANRTARWAGRLIQVQNLPRNIMKDLKLARKIVRSANADALDLIYADIPNVLSQLIRTAFVAPEGSRFIVNDFSSIEARIIAWLAGERWRLEVFAGHGKIYEASAAQMFKLPIEKVDKELRQKGKIAELALGYQGGVNALISMGALNMGLNEDELPEIVSRWRQANKHICLLWDRLNCAALDCIQNGVSRQVMKGLVMRMQKGIFFIKLPSGRELAYFRARVGQNRFGNSAILYDGLNQTTKVWGMQETYGGKLVENIVQAIARDCLAEALQRVHAKGYKIVMHVHDEIISEMPLGAGSVAEVNKLMALPMPWAPDLLLGAEGYETTFYKKD